MGEDLRPPTPPERREPAELRADVHVQKSLVRCPFCHDEVRTDDGADAWLACGGCLARHHASCWNEAGGCGTCRGTTPLALAKPAARSTSRAALLAVLGLVAIGVIVAALSAVVYVTLAPEPPGHEAPKADRVTYPGETAPVARLREQAEAGDTSAMFDLARALALGEGVGIDRRAAAEWYRRAGASGHARACLAYADLLERGAPAARVPRDPEEAKLWVRRAGDLGDGEAAYRYARLVEDDTESLRWIRRAVELGHVPAMNAVASRLMQPEATPDELAEVDSLLDRAGTAAVPIVMKKLANALWEKDPSRAVEWYRRAAEGGDVDALLLYPRALDALGRLEDADRAYKHAVDQRVPVSLYRLGLLSARDEARPLAVGETIAGELPLNDPQLFTIDLEAGQLYSLFVTDQDVTDRFEPELVVRDAASRVIDAPRGIVDPQSARRPLNRVDFMAPVSGRYYLQLHSVDGEDRRYRISARKL